MKRLQKFENGQRVRVLREAYRGTAMDAVGTVTRLRRGDDGAWVELDERYADDKVHPFPAADERARKVVAFPEDCEVAP